MTALPVELRLEAAAEDARDGHDMPAAPTVVTGPLWPNPHAVTWPRMGGGGTCSHQPPDSCSYCDGSLDDWREAAKVRRAVKRTEVQR